MGKLGAACLSLNDVCEVIVEAPKSCKLHPTSIACILKVVQDLDMLRMDIWVQPNTVPHVQVWVDFLKIAGMAKFK